MILEKINNRDKDSEGEDLQLNDILESIRGIIDNRENIVKSVEKSEKAVTNLVDQDDSVLELTNVVCDINNNVNSKANLKEEDKTLLSSETKDRAEVEFNKLDDYLAQSANNSKKEESFDSAVNRLMLPLIKHWLDNNLPGMVEKIIAKEIREMILKRK